MEPETFTETSANDRSQPILNQEHAALIGLAYRYALPLYEVARLRYALQFDPLRPHHLPPNQLFHKRNLATSEDRFVTTPNADTLYSIAILDLREGSVCIDVPDMAGRYYSVALVDAYTNVFAYIGRRTTGTQMASYLLLGPGNDNAPEHSVSVLRAPTPLVVMLVRILVNGPNDIEAAHHLQDGFRLTAPAGTAEHNTPIAPFSDSGENFVVVVNEALTENPPPPADEPVLRRIGEVGIGPHAISLNPELRQAWNDYFPQVQRALAEIAKSRRQLGGGHRGAEIVNGWIYPPTDKGNYGTDYDMRALIALAGLFAHRREENMAVGAVTDSEGRPFDHDHRYRLRLPAQMPVDGFWSLSIYSVESDGRRFFQDNPMNRYAIGDRTPGLRRNPDGSLDILIQRETPPAEEMSNWLPMPAGPFHLGLRNYQPRAELLEGRFHYPAIERID